MEPLGCEPRLLDSAVNPQSQTVGSGHRQTVTRQTIGSVLSDRLSPAWPPADRSHITNMTSARPPVARTNARKHTALWEYTAPSTISRSRNEPSSSPCFITQDVVCQGGRKQLKVFAYLGFDGIWKRSFTTLVNHTEFWKNIFNSYY